MLKKSNSHNSSEHEKYFGGLDNEDAYMRVASGRWLLCFLPGKWFCQTFQLFWFLFL